MSIFDFLHSFIDEVRPQRGGVAFQAPEPISNEEYQAYRHHGGGIHSYTGDID